MLTLNDGRADLWQWDTGRTLSVDADCSQVHFSNKVFGRSIDVDVADGVAIIPDILLQTDKELNVWAFVGTAENGYTKISKTFKVNRRNKPADYVFTPPDQTSIEEIKERLEYLEQNPVEAPVKSVNGKTGAVELNAEDVGALPTTYTPPDQTAEQVGADPAGTAASAVSQHNTDATSHNDLRIALKGLSDRINVVLDSDDTTLDQMSEVVAYIKSNKSMIDAITTSKVSVADIVDNLTTNVTNKPLSAAQGVALKALIDGIVIPDKLPNPNALTFTGAVTGSYDGSMAVSVEIPSAVTDDYIVKQIINGATGEKELKGDYAGAMEAWQSGKKLKFVDAFSFGGQEIIHHESFSYARVSSGFTFVCYGYRNFIDYTLTESGITGGYADTYLNSLYIETPTGFYLKSPSEKWFRVKVSDTGELSTERIE